MTYASNLSNFSFNELTIMVYSLQKENEELKKKLDQYQKSVLEITTESGVIQASLVDENKRLNDVISQGIEENAELTYQNSLLKAKNVAVKKEVRFKEGPLNEGNPVGKSSFFNEVSPTTLYAKPSASENPAFVTVQVVKDGCYKIRTTSAQPARQQVQGPAIPAKSEYYQESSFVNPKQNCLQKTFLLNGSVTSESFT